MKPSDKQELARIGAETAVRTSAAQASRNDAQDHVKSSREAIARSFEALALARSSHRPTD